MEKGGDKEGVVSYPSNKYSRESSSGFKSKTSIGTIIILILLIPLIVLVFVYGKAYVETPQFERAMAEVRNFFSFDKNPLVRFYRETLSPEAIVEGIWETKSNKTISGVILKDFRLLAFESKSVPAGTDWFFEYVVETKNADASNIPVKFHCAINLVKGKKIEPIIGEIIPNEGMQEGVTNVDKRLIKCKFGSEQTKDFEGAVSVEGGIEFPFETKDAKLKVYFTDYEAFRGCQNKNEDFFECFGLDEDLPIKTIYNGEPLSIAIGVGRETMEQPVIIPDEEYTVPMFIGLFLKREWSGRVKELTDLSFYVPEGIEIDEERSYNNGRPTIACPFEFVGIEDKDGLKYNKYSVSSMYLEDINFKEAFAIETAKRFYCELKALPEFSSFLSSVSYFTGYYFADAGYVFAPLNKTEVITAVKPAEALVT